MKETAVFRAARFLTVWLAVWIVATAMLQPGTLLAQADCTLNSSFQALHDQIPDLVGTCSESEQLNPQSDLIEQHTSGGVLMLRPSDGLTTFTDGTTLWLLGPEGLVSRALADPPFPWEAPVAAATTEPAGESNPAAPPATTSTLPVCTEPSPFPGDISIVPPAQDLNPKLAALSGAWQGKWGGILPSRLVIERIEPTNAVGVYSWGDHPQGLFGAGWQRLQFTVEPAGKLLNEIKEVRQGRFFGLALSFLIGDDLTAVYGVREQQSGPNRFPPSTVTMTRCSL